MGPLHSTDAARIREKPRIGRSRSRSLQCTEFTKILTHDQPQPVRFRPPPIALEFAGKSKNRDWNGAGLNHALHRGFVRNTADTTDRIYDDVDLITRSQCVEGRKHNADLGIVTQLHEPADARSHHRGHVALAQGLDVTLMFWASLMRVFLSVKERPLDVCDGRFGERFVQLAHHPVPHFLVQTGADLAERLRISDQHQR
jgi:hypothetical protein